MWYEHWGLSRDPYLDRDASFVSLPGHEEAVARLLYCVDTCQPAAFLAGESGLGKTRVLARALAQARRPSRRFAVVSDPPDADGLFARLAEKLGPTTPIANGRGSAWHALERAVRVCSVQGLGVVLAVDGVSCLERQECQDDLWRLVHLGERGGPVTVLVVGGDDAGTNVFEAGVWTLAVRLRPLLRSEVESYLMGRLAEAGCEEPIFMPRAVTRLHHLTGGNPRGLNRMASLCLMAAAARRLEAVSSELVEGVLHECRLPWEAALVS